MGKTKDKTVYVVKVEDYRNDPAFDVNYENGTFLKGTFTSRESAEKVAIAEAEAAIPTMYCEHAYGLESGETAWGDWDDLPITEADKTEDDTYSQEGIMNLVRKAGGEIRIETQDDCIYFKISIVEQTVNK